VDTADIEVFLTLAEELHFGRTAERLHLAQPRVSRVIAALEIQAGGKLFERTSRMVRLTPLGMRLRDRVQPAYLELQAAFEDARRAARETAGELRIGFTPTTHGEALTRLAAAFEAGHHGRRAALQEVQIFEPYAALRDGDVDVLVNWLALDEPDLTAGPAIDFRDRVVAVSTAHPLARRQSVHAEELADYDNVGFFASAPTALMDAILPPRTPSGRPVHRTDLPAHVSIFQMLDTVARGLGIHPTMADVVVFRRDDIALVPIVGLPPLPLGLIWCTAHENGRIRALADTARQLLPGRQERAGNRRPLAPEEARPETTTFSLGMILRIIIPNGGVCYRLGPRISCRGTTGAAHGLLVHDRVRGSRSR
jgi:DNA-binding transcriptional LysR family regulator